MLKVLDSTVLIDFLRGRPAVARVTSLRGEGDVPATTAVNVEELVRGLRPEENEHGGVLVTGNPKDFPMADVTVEHWPVGS